MQRHDGLAFAKLRQGRCRLGHLRFDNVQHLLAHVNIFDVQRFEVLTAFSFTFVLDFSQDVRHLIAHHSAATDVRLHEQRPRGGSHHRLKRFFQVDETPVDPRRQGQEATRHSPSSNVEHPRFDVGMQFPFEIGSQDEIAVRAPFQPPEIVGQFVVELHPGHDGMGLQRSIVEEQVLALPAEGEVESSVVAGLILVRVRLARQQRVELNLLESVDEGLHETHATIMLSCHMSDTSIEVARACFEAVSAGSV